ncbi:MAG: DUF2080 family transposase-associated protein [Candidatus Micrarchaeia archaeon]
MNKNIKNGNINTPKKYIGKHTYVVILKK